MGSPNLAIRRTSGEDEQAKVVIAAGEQVAEVDHAADGAVRGEDVGRMQVAVEP